MNLDDYLRRAAIHGLDGLTLWRQRDGRWQGNVRDQDDKQSWCVRGDETDPAAAVRSAIVGWRYDLFPEFVGRGEDGPLGGVWNDLRMALIENRKAREAADL